MKRIALLLALCLAVTALSSSALAEDVELAWPDAEVGEAVGDTGAPGLVAEPEGDGEDAEVWELPQVWTEQEQTQVDCQEGEVGEDFAVEAALEDLFDGGEYTDSDAQVSDPEPAGTEEAGTESAESGPATPRADPNGPRLAASEITLGVGEAYELNASLPEGMTGVITYTSSDAAIAGVSESGAVTALAPGEAVVTAAATEGGVSECFVHVKPAPDVVSFSASTFSVGVGETTDALKVLLSSAGGASAGKCAFSSSNKKIVTVDASGAIRGVKAGKATVTVRTYNGLSAKCKVTVAKAPGKVKATADRNTVGVGESVQIGYTLPKKTAGQVSYSSENTAVLTVDAVTGVAQTVGVGQARVKVVTFNGKKSYLTIAVVPAPESIAFEADSVKLGVGMKLTATASVNDGSASAISYAVEDPGVATCTGGALKGMAPGETVLTATTYNGLAARCTVTVTDAPARVTLPFKSLDIGVKQRVRLSPSVGDSASTYTFSTSNKQIVTVNAEGVLTGVKKGSATVTVKTYNKKSVKLKVNVVKAPGSVTILPADAELGVGEKLQLSAGLPKGTASGLTYSSSDPSVVTVDALTGEATGVAPGKAAITVATDNGKKAKATVTVTALPEWVEIENGLAELATGQSLQLSVSLSPGSKSPLWFTSRDTSVAEVSAEGVVTGIASGQTTILVETAVTGVSAEAVVTVHPSPDALSLGVTQLTLNAGETAQLTPVIPEGTSAAFTYSSSNTEVAGISETGAVVALSRGEATLSVQTHNGLKAEASLTVLDPWFPDSVELTNIPKTLSLDETLQMDWTVTPEGAVADLTWESSNESAVTVDSQGLLKAVGYGSATVTAVSGRNRALRLEFTVEVVIDGLVLELPARTTDIAGIPANLAKIEALRLASIEQIKALQASKTITAADAKKRKSIVNNAFKDYAFPWMTPEYQVYWKAANSENGAKDFKPDVVYYGMPYISTGKNRQYNVAKALKEARYTSSDEGYYLLNRKNLLSGKYVGNDCSCFVDAAIWGTGSSHSADRTSDIAKSSSYKTVKNIKSMRTGDLICKGYAHVVMFLYYTDADKTQAMIIENGGIEPGTNTVHCMIMDLSYYTQKGYSVRRLKSLG